MAITVSTVINKKGFIPETGVLYAVCTFTVTPGNKVFKVTFQTSNPADAAGWIHLQIADWIERANRIADAHAAITLGPYAAP